MMPLPPMTNSRRPTTLHVCPCRAAGCSSWLGSDDHTMISAGNTATVKSWATTEARDAAMQCTPLINRDWSSVSTGGRALSSLSMSAA